MNFWIDADIDNTGTVTGGQIRFITSPVTGFSVPIVGPNATSTLAPFSLNNIATTSGSLNLNIAQSIPDFSPASLALLQGFSGGMQLAGVFGPNNNVGFYAGSITAVPEPGSNVGSRWFGCRMRRFPISPFQKGCEVV